MSTLAQSWRRTESGRDEPYAWRRPDPRGWIFVPIGWRVFCLALWTSLGNSPSTAVGLRVAVGFFRLAALVASALLIAGSNHVWPTPLALAEAFAVVIPVMDGELLAGRIACLLVAITIPALAILAGRAQRGRLLHRYSEPRVVLSPQRPMTDYGSWSLHRALGLPDARVVLLRRWWKQRELVLKDTGGCVLALVRELPHPRSEDGMRVAFDFWNTVAPRCVIRVGTPDGEQLFFIDGAKTQTDGAMLNGAGLERSFATVRPDGRQDGREGPLFFDEVFADVTGAPGFQLEDDLYEWGWSLCVEERDGAVPFARARRTGLGRNGWRRYFTLLDADGATFGQSDYGPESPRSKRSVRLRDRTPVELRMGAIASMIIDGSEGRIEVLASDASAPESYPRFGDNHVRYYRWLRPFAGRTLESGRN